MKLLLNVDVKLHGDTDDWPKGILWGRGDVVFAQKVNLYDESEFCRIITWLENNSWFRTYDCIADVEDCVKLIYEGPRADA